MSESNIENEAGYQDAGEIGPDSSVFLALAYAGVLSQ